MQKTTNITETFTIICAWCNQILNDKPVTNSSKQSHTICQKCLEKLRQEIKTVSQKSTNIPFSIIN
ncbi:MAG: hypothetical protein HY819_16515 [Acidobacteria bacterium]|nr:hypothetical protein [Acidobacteriota bacterium]